MLPDTIDVLVIGARPGRAHRCCFAGRQDRRVIVADSQAEGQNTSRTARSGLRGGGLPLTSRSQGGLGARSRVPG